MSLSLAFEPKQQTRTLKAAGYTVASLKAAGFAWASGAWIAKDTPTAKAAHHAIMAVLHAQDHAFDSCAGMEWRQIVTAKATHECAECGRPIGAGEEAMQIKRAEGGTFTYQHLCTCCYDYSTAGAA